MDTAQRSIGFGRRRQRKGFSHFLTLWRYSARHFGFTTQHRRKMFSSSSPSTPLAVSSKPSTSLSSLPSPPRKPGYPITLNSYRNRSLQNEIKSLNKTLFNGCRCWRWSYYFLWTLEDSVWFSFFANSW